MGNQAMGSSTNIKARSATSYIPAFELEPGDRFPNFMLPDQTGAVRSFLERAKGRPLVIIADADDAALRSLAAAELEKSGVDVLALVAETPAEAALRASSAEVEYPLLGDSAGAIRSALRQKLGFGPRGAFVVLLDPNQRVTAVKASLKPAEVVDWAIARARELPAPKPSRQLDMVAPVLLVPDVLTPENCRALIDRWEHMGHDEGQVNSIVAGVETRRVHKTLKSRRDHMIEEDSVLRELVQVIGRRIAPELDKAFGFPRFRFDRFVVTCYDAERGDFFRRHRDNQTPTTADRKYALTLNLNTGEYEGGELLFPEYGEHLYNPPVGGAILFSCSLLHEALPVTKGRRFTLLNFLRA